MPLSHQAAVDIPSPGPADPDEVALLLENCGIEDELKAAIDERDRREITGLGDIEPYHHLRYPRSLDLSHPSPSPPLSPLTSPSPSPPPTPSLPPQPTTPTACSPSSNALQQAGAARNHRQRGKAARSAKKKAFRQPGTYKIRSTFSKRYSNPLQHRIPSFRMLAIKTVACGAYIARRIAAKAGIPTLDEVLAEGLRLVRWNGRTPTLILDAVRRVIAVLGGFPGDVSAWQQCRKDVREVMAEVKDELKFCERGDRRGSFCTVAVGTSYGGGQKRPGTLRHSKRNAAACAKLLASKAMKRVAGFGSSMFAFYAPKMYCDYVEKLNKLYDRYPDLDYNWNNSVFPCASFNFGPNALCVEHNDHGNRAAGWCSIFCDGTFDATRGGHLILRQLGIVVEFPPGSTVLIPSACITHGNTAIGKNETRWSFTQYASGGLFRFVDYGFRTWREVELGEEGEADAFRAQRETRWKSELNLLSVVDELAADRQAAGLLS